DGTYPWLDPTGPGSVAPDAVATTSGSIPAASESQAVRGKRVSKAKSSESKQVPPTEPDASTSNLGTEGTTPPSSSSVEPASTSKRKSSSDRNDPKKLRTAKQRTSGNTPVSATCGPPASITNTDVASTERQAIKGKKASKAKSSGPKPAPPTEHKAIATNDPGTESTTAPSGSSVESGSTGK
ncbi:hypothetical protein BGX34_008031, partial [Mortierella sp. NVP85]